MDEKLKIALAETEFLDGMSIEGNNFKVLQFLSLREHLLEYIKRCDQLESEILELKPEKGVANVCSVCGANAEIKVVGKEIWYCDDCIA